MKLVTSLGSESARAVSRRALAALFAVAGLATACAWPQCDATLDDKAAVVTPPQSEADAKQVRPTSLTQIELCQALGPAAPCAICGLDCAGGTCGQQGWNAARPIDWQRFAQGEYVGHSRSVHVESYLLRVYDELEFVFRLTRVETSRPYQLNVGDEIRVESFTDKLLDRDLTVQPDGTITLRLLGQVRA
ncbi:MAG TPA: polysaccharide biosynthesis/export family protein, partial [Pirellulales bacterium]|nr:polysaccharide biosynthesis/export family protein [Pirellulales bacterium]